MSFKFQENGTFQGQVQFTNQINVPAGTWLDVDFSIAANIGAAKLVHQHRVVYSEESATSAADGAHVIHIAEGAGTLLAVRVGAVVACTGAGTVTFDLLKNGVSILDAPKAIDSGDAAYALVDAVIDTAAFAADSVLEVTIDEEAGGGAVAKGVFVQLDITEAFE